MVGGMDDWMVEHTLFLSNSFQLKRIAKQKKKAFKVKSKEEKRLVQPSSGSCDKDVNLSRTKDHEKVKKRSRGHD